MWKMTAILSRPQCVNAARPELYFADSISNALSLMKTFEFRINFH